MTKYLLLYRAQTSPEEQMGNASPEEAQAGMDAWMGWAAKAGPAIVDMGAPTAAAGVVGAGSAPSPGFLGGYSVLEADSREALDGLLEGHPHLMLDGAAIEVYELLALPGMG